MIGATLLTLILLWFAHFRRLSNSQLLLVGVALGVICGAFMTWMVYFSTSLDLRQLMYWMMGSFRGGLAAQSAAGSDSRSGCVAAVAGTGA